ncbi:hypothetical protein Z948_3316 [Sulfitobacter donghicola DSW-25 = KCTC 12864 = JCM 14565]|nr:hypothetical protein Z948_3316 [Sulfitobacter donghicola DSW-25 = KCTC 12864 = JCM 14565]
MAGWRKPGLSTLQSARIIVAHHAALLLNHIKADLPAGLSTSPPNKRL